MEMTNKESADYNSLSSQDKKRFAQIEEEHPNWSCKQVLKKMTIDDRIDSTVEQCGGDVDRNDPKIWVLILEGAKQTLSKFRSIGADVLGVIDNAIQTIKITIKDGIKQIGNLISKLLGNLFD